MTMPKIPESAALEETPFDMFASELEAVDEALAPLEARASELEREFTEKQAENAREIAATKSNRKTALTNFFQRLSEAPELYRSVFELMVNEQRTEPPFSSEAAEESLPAFEFVHNKANELTALATYLEDLQEAAPSLLIKTVRHRLVSNPGCLSYPTENDLKRSEINGIKATIGLVKPGEKLVIEHSSIYKPGRGRYTIAEQISLPITEATSVETQLGAFDHDVWVSDKPAIKKLGSQEIGLLSSGVRIGLGLNLTPSIKVEGTDDEVAMPLKRLSLFVGKACVEQVLTQLEQNTTTKHDRAALRTLTTTLQEQLGS